MRLDSGLVAHFTRLTYGSVSRFVRLLCGWVACNWVDRFFYIYIYIFLNDIRLKITSNCCLRFDFLNFSSTNFKFEFSVFRVIKVLLSEIEVFYTNLSPGAFSSFHLNRGGDKIKMMAKFKNWIKKIQSTLEVFIWVIESVSDGCHSVQLYFKSVIFRMRVIVGHTRVRSVSHGSVEDRLFELSA